MNRKQIGCLGGLAAVLCVVLTVLVGLVLVASTPTDLEHLLTPEPLAAPGPSATRVLEPTSILLPTFTPPAPSETCSPEHFVRFLEVSRGAASYVAGFTGQMAEDELPTSEQFAAMASHLDDYLADMETVWPRECDEHYDGLSYDVRFGFEHWRDGYHEASLGNYEMATVKLNEGTLVIEMCMVEMKTLSEQLEYLLDNPIQR